jgi:hypothetical protein
MAPCLELRELPWVAIAIMPLIAAMGGPGCFMTTTITTPLSRCSAKRVPVCGCVSSEKTKGTWTVFQIDPRPLFVLPKLVDKDPSFISWTTEVLRWLRAATPEKIDCNGYPYRATKRVKTAMNEAKIEVVLY